MATEHPTFTFTKTGRKSMYSACAHWADGRQAVVGTVRRFYIRHLLREGWEATASDGHRGVHNARWQAAAALVWDGKGYPFPILRHA